MDFSGSGIKFHNGLPTIVRETMLQSMGNAPKAAFLLDALYFHGISPGSYLKESEIHAILGVSRRLVYSGLRTIFFHRRKDPNHSGRGRKAYEYRIPESIQVVFELELSGAMTLEQAPYSGRLRASSPQKNTDMLLGISDGLYQEDFQTLKTYRLGLERELILAHRFNNGLEIARERRAERLGISARTSREYDKILGTGIEAQFERIELKNKDWKRAPREVGEKRPEWIEVYEPGVFKPRTMPYLQFLCWKYLKLGYKVVKVRRLFNRYHPKPHWRGYQVPQNEAETWSGDIFSMPQAAELPY